MRSSAPPGGSGLSVWLSLAWHADLAAVIGPVGAWIVIALVAYLPGMLVAFLAASLLFDRQPPLLVTHPTTAVTIVIAARNEEDGITETIRYTGNGDYDGPLTVILADNGSTDRTVETALAAARAPRRAPRDARSDTR